VAISSEQEATLLGCRIVIVGLKARALIDFAKAHLVAALQ
jgi:hypothetical protein